MGTRKRAGEPKHIVRTIAKEIERTVRRNKLDIMSSICGTTRNQVGQVTKVNSQVTYDCNESNNDERTKCIERERTNSSSSSTATAVSDDRDSDSNHKL